MNITANSCEQINSESEEKFSTSEIVAGAILLLVLMVLALKGNLLTCVIYSRKACFRTPTNISILFLSLSDVLMAIFVMPFSLASLIDGEWSSTPEACTLHSYSFNALIGLSFTTLTCTAVIRYLRVVKSSLHQRYVTPKVALTTMTSIWLVYSLLLSFRIFFEGVTGDYIPLRTICQWQAPNKTIASFIDSFVYSLALVFTLITSISYYKVLRYVAQHNNNVTTNLHQDQSRSHLEEAKVNKTLLFVAASFVICWVPYAVLRVINVYSLVKLPSFANLLQTIVVFISSAVNPVIYGFTNRRFRKECKELLYCLLPLKGQIVPA